MKYNDYLKGSTKVSEIGFGSWQLGNGDSWSPMTDEEGIQLVEEAIFKGINFFDTAPNYANGHSERLIGKAIEGKDRQQLVINTKFGHTIEGHTNFSHTAIRKSVEGSLKRLNTDYIDSLLLHNPSREIIKGDPAELYEVLEDLKREGKILAYGASLDNSDEIAQFLKHTKGELIEAMFNINHQDARHAFDLTKEKGVAVIAKIPLDSGWLSGKYNQNSVFTGIRSRWSKEEIKMRADVVDMIRNMPSKDQTLAQYAISYCLAYDAVKTVIPGCVDTKQLNNNILSPKYPMTSEDLTKLESLYEDCIKGFKLPW